MKQKRHFLLLAAISVWAASQGLAPAWGAMPPRAIVSLDLCADQYVLGLAAPGQIRALSPDARRDVSFLRDKANNIPQTRPRAEEVLALRPDLIVRTYGGGPRAAALFEKAGIPVLTIGWAGTIDDSILRIREAAAALGTPDAGEPVIEAIRAVPAPERSGGRTALYLTPGGVTTGPGSYVNDLLTAAGYTNYITEAGWRSVPLERILADPPDILIRGYFNSATISSDQWSLARHPRLAALANAVPTYELGGDVLSCAGWGIPKAINDLSNARTSQ